MNEQAQTSAEAGANTASIYGIMALKAMLGVLLFTIIAFTAMWVRKRIEDNLIIKLGEEQREIVIVYGRIAFAVIIAFGALASLILAGAKLELFAGALGLGLGFALKDPLANFMAGILILTQGKVAMGDSMEIDGVRGVVNEIKSHAVILKCPDNSLVTVPNIEILMAKVTTFNKSPLRRIEIDMDISYDTNIEAAKQLITEVARAHPGIEMKPEAYTVIKAIAASSITLTVRAWVDTHSKWWLTKSSLMHKLLDTLQQSGVNIPYPIQTLRLAELAHEDASDNNHLLTTLKMLEDARKAREIANNSKTHAVSQEKADAIKDATIADAANVQIEQPVIAVANNEIQAEQSAAAVIAPVVTVENPVAVAPAPDTQAVTAPVVAQGTIDPQAVFTQIPNETVGSQNTLQTSTPQTQNQTNNVQLTA